MSNSTNGMDKRSPSEENLDGLIEALGIRFSDEQEESNFTLLISDIEGRYRLQSADDAFFRLTGISLNGESPVLIEQIFEKEQAALIASHIKIAEESGSEISWEEKYEEEDLSRKYLIRISSISGAGQGQKSFFLSAIYIRDPKADADELRSVLDQSMDVICTIDEEGRFVKVNRASEKVWGYTPEEIEGKKYMSLVHKDDHDLTVRAATGIMDGVDMTNFENRYVRKDGSLVHMIWSARWNEDDQIMYAVARDATAIKESERKVEESIRRFRGLVQEGSDLIAILKVSGEYTYITPNYKEYLGFEVEELIGKNAFSFIHPDDLERVKKELENVEGKKRIRMSPYRFQHGDGSWRWIETVISDLRDEPAIGGLIANSRDITEEHYYKSLEALEREILERDAAEEQLNEVLLGFLNGVETLHDGIHTSIQFAEKGVLTGAISPSLPVSFLDILDGMPIEEGEGSCGSAAFRKEIVIVEDISNDPLWKDYKEYAAKAGLLSSYTTPILDSAKNSVATFTVYHTEARRPSARELNTIRRTGQLLQIMLENRRVLGNLKKSKERFEYVTRATSEAIWDFDPATEKLYWGEGFQTLFGYNVDHELNGIENWLNKVHPDDILDLEGQLKNLMKGEKSRLDNEYRFRKANGKYAYVHDKAMVFLNSAGHIDRIVGAMEDVTVRKKEEERLRLMESVVTNIEDGVLITKASPMIDHVSPEIQFANKAFEKLSGYPVDELIGNTAHMLYGPNRDHEGLRELDKALRRMEPAELEIIQYHKDGSEYWVHQSITPLANREGEYTHFITVHKDITERKNRELQQQLLNDISRAFNRTDSLHSALEESLKPVMNFGSFSMLEFWLVDREEEQIHLSAHVRNGHGADIFYDQSGSIRSFKRGEGLPGVAWQSKEAQFWDELGSNKKFARSSAAKKAGFQVGYGFPILDKESVVGVLVFGVKEAKQMKNHLGPLFEELCKQLGSEIRRKSAEEELSRIFSFAPDIICVAGMDGYFKKVNPAMSKLLGYSEEELLTKPIESFTHPEDRERTSGEIEALNQKKGSPSFENRYITKDGRTVWLSWVTKSFYEDGLIYSVARNVTDEKVLEQLLTQTNRLARVGSWELDFRENENEMYWSEMTREILEVDENYNPTLTGGFEFYSPESKTLIQEAVDQAIDTGGPFDLELLVVTANGNERWVRCIGESEMVGKECQRIYGSYQDIHERKVAELNLQERNRHINAIASLNAALVDHSEWFEALENHLELIGEAVNSDRVYYFENRYDPVTGEGFTTQKLEWCREGVTSQLNNPDLDEIPFAGIPELMGPMIEGKPSMGSISELQEDNVTRHVMESQDIKSFLVIPVNVKGQFYGFVGFDNCTDESKWSDEEIRTLKTITSNLAVAIEREQTETERRELLNEKNRILESISDAFYAINEEWAITYFNQEAERLLGKSVDEVIGKNMWDVFAPARDTELYAVYKEVMEEKIPRSLEYYYLPIDSWFDVSAYPAENGISVYFKNIDDRKDAQEKIVRKTLQLDAIANFNSLLIQKDRWIEALDESLQSFGFVAGADRAYFFENKTDENGEFIETSMRLEWVRKGVKPEIGNPVHRNQEPELIGEIYEPLSNNQPFNMIVSEMENNDLRELMQSQDIKSLLMVPVFIERKFAGFIGFDDCREERRWEEEEIAFLQTISINLASAIENEEAEEALQKAYMEKNEILESIGDGFFAVDHDWVVTYWNHKSEELTNMPREKIIGKKLWEQYEDAMSLEFYTQYHKAVDDRVDVHFEEYYPGIDKWLEVSAYPSSLGLSVFFKDVTERIKADQRMRELNTALEQQTIELAKSNEELEQFAFVASHDLQEPLRMITSFLSRLEDKYADDLDDRARRYIGFATDGARRMRQIILDLLDYSRAGYREPEMEEIDLNNLLKEVSTLHGKTIRETGASLEWDEMPVIVASEGSIKQVFQNLIGNALKYHEPGQKPVVRISCVEEDEYRQFTVEDNGIGINEEYSEKIFNIFQRLHGDEEYSGTGMGLAICRKVIEMHGGRIWVESDGKSGSTFHFTIKKMKRDERK
ncbi:MAG: PAS domain S-box protein [Balneolaceae bacterium]|nr:PAS domain S-box protein [Balneolaceae bacterium]MCH8549552.1 PAS domain S-box protein [Balneolaceae bacterium]